MRIAVLPWYFCTLCTRTSVASRARVSSPTTPWPCDTGWGTVVRCICSPAELLGSLQWNRESMPRPGQQLQTHTHYVWTRPTLISENQDSGSARRLSRLNAWLTIGGNLASLWCKGKGRPNPQWSHCHKILTASVYCTVLYCCGLYCTVAVCAHVRPPSWISASHHFETGFSSVQTTFNTLYGFFGGGASHPRDHLFFVHCPGWTWRGAHCTLEGNFKHWHPQITTRWSQSPSQPLLACQWPPPRGCIVRGKRLMLGFCLIVHESTVPLNLRVRLLPKVWVQILPPIRSGLASTTVTSKCPEFTRTRAVAKPDIPAPITSTFVLGPAPSLSEDAILWRLAQMSKLHFRGDQKSKASNGLD